MFHCTIDHLPHGFISDDYDEDEDEACGITASDRAAAHCDQYIDEFGECQYDPFFNDGTQYDDFDEESESENFIMFDWFAEFWQCIEM